MWVNRSLASSSVVSGPTKKSAAAICRPALRVLHVNQGVARDRKAGHFRGIVGMRETAADRAALADLIMRDMRHRRLEQRLRRQKTRVGFDVAPANARAEGRAAGVDLDVAQARHLAQIDQAVRRSEPKGEDRHETLAAGDDLRLVVRLGQKGQRLIERRRAGIIERTRFHAGLSVSLPQPNSSHVLTSQSTRRGA